MLRSLRLSLLVLVVVCIALLAVGAAEAKNNVGSLTNWPVPTSPDVDKFIRDQTAAAQLGKALFWDMQAGSDGRTACASCHFNAGADNRSRNQLNPHGDPGFAANQQLTVSDFPIADERVVGSQGVVPSAFKGIADGNPFDMQDWAPVDTAFHVGSVNVRRTTGRNTPSAINAVFNFRQFWDGRAQNDFNGVNPFGARDAGAQVGHVDGTGALDKMTVSIRNASLASQATGPPGNPVEMSADGRTLSDIGKKLLSLRPLASQDVSRSDSLLGEFTTGRGLNVSYQELIERAFKPEWWDGTGLLPAANGRSYALIHYNFPLFWGLAISAYESTLVSDATPLDRFLDGDATALSDQARQGFSVFAGKGDCAECHNGAEMTGASVSAVQAAGPVDDDTAANDTGFFNLGVRPTASDPGNGGSDPFGAPLSEARRLATPATAVDGSFKTPGLRNVALTAPYFHNGGKGDLRQVVDFYDRGGDFPNAEKNPAIKPLGLSDGEKDALVAFLDSLTDPRVRDQSAPFDHPQLFVPIGAQTRDDGGILTDAGGRAVDCFKEVPATGQAGGAPLTRFPAFTGPPCDVPRIVSEEPPPPTAGAVTVRIPSVTVPARSCTSRRNFTLRIYRPRGDRIRRLIVTVNGRRVADLRRGKLGRAPIDLRGLPKGVVAVKVTARTAKGRKIFAQRKYRTCTARRG